MTNDELLSLRELPDPNGFDTKSRTLAGGMSVRLSVQRDCPALSREEADPFSVFDESGREWEIGRINGELVRRRVKARNRGPASWEEGPAWMFTD